MIQINKVDQAREKIKKIQNIFCILCSDLTSKVNNNKVN